MVDLPSSPLAEIDPEFEKVALETGGWTYARIPDLTMREKLLLCLTNDVCRGHNALALRLHVQASVHHGTPFSDILALIRFVAPYAGYPAAADALEYVNTVRQQLGIQAPGQDEDPGVAGEGVEPPRFWVSADQWSAEFIESRTSRAWRESRLSGKERAYIALVADIANQTLGPSFRGHVEQALLEGATPAQVRAVVRFTSEFGCVKAANALRALDEILAIAETRGETVRSVRLVAA
ncbi:hypothetical protein GCM10027168_30880 [Streptomyces capparidis]